MINRRLLLAALAAPALVRAERPRVLTLLSGSRAGSPGDQTARAFAPYLERYLPHSRVVIAPMEGGGGSAALRALTAAEPDASVAGFIATPALTARLLEPELSGLLDRLELVGAVSAEPFALVVPPSVSATAREILVAAAREGTPLATSARGGPGHVAVLRIGAALGLNLRTVAFPAAAAARSALLGGTVRLAILPLSSVLGAIRDGRLRAASVTAQDDSTWPDLPGREGLPRVCIRRGLALPVGVDRSKVARLAASLRGVAGDPEFADVLPGSPARFLSGPEWLAQTQQERSQLAPLWRPEMSVATRASPR